MSGIVSPIIQRYQAAET